MRHKLLKNIAFMLTAGSCLVLQAGCAPAPYRWQQPSQKVHASYRTEEAGPLRWALLPEFTKVDYVLGSPDRSRRLIAEGLRIVEHPDGSLERSDEVFPVDEVIPIALPPRLGGGTLFYASKSETSLWRSRTFVSELKPLARIEKRVKGIVLGFDRLYLQLANTTEVIALDADSGAATDLGPLPASPGYRSMAFADPWLGAVQSDVRGLLVTFDAGASWHSSTRLGPRTQVELIDGNIVLSNKHERLRLTSTGRLERYHTGSRDDLFAEHNHTLLREQEPEQPVRQRRPTGSLLGPRPLRDAVLYGFPVGADQAVVASHGAVGMVRLSDGKTLRARADAYRGTRPCHAVRLEDAIGFICGDRDQGTQILRLGSDLSLQLVRDFAVSREVVPSGNGALVVKGPCEDKAPEEAHSSTRHYCILTADGGSNEFSVHRNRGTQRVVGLTDGRTAVLIPPSLGRAGTLSLVDNGEVKQVPLKLPQGPKAGLLSAGLWLEGTTEVKPAVLGAWVVGAREYIGVRVELDGTVTVQDRESSQLERTLFSGPIAFEISNSGIAHETNDYGEHWRTVELPDSLSPLDAKQALKEERLPLENGCSRVGCAYGAWLKTGTKSLALSEEDKPENSGNLSTRAPTLRQAALPNRLSLRPSSYSRWHLKCRLSGANSTNAAATRARLKSSLGQIRRGFSSNFGAAGLLTSPRGANIESTAYRPFLGISGPGSRGAGIRFDFGMDDDVQFRAYAWGTRADSWPRGSTWAVRVANRFALDSIWTTAATSTPWPDFISAAQTFGADRSSRFSSNWSLTLDPSEEVGLLRIAARGSTELHVVERGRTIKSYARAEVGKIAGAVKVNGRIYYGVHSGAWLSIFALDSSGPKLFGRYPAAHDTKARIIRTDDAKRLGILVHARGGSWHLFPLTPEGQPEPALSYTRKFLNQTRKSCGISTSGWLVRSALPLTRMSPSSSLGFVDFTDQAIDLRARRVLLKLVLTEGALCVADAAAQLADGQLNSDPIVKSGSELPGTTILTLSDRSRHRRLQFRCTL